MPREILLGRHQAAVPKLDALRQEMVTELNSKGTKVESEKINLASWCLGALDKIWVELVWSSRHIWAGLAAVWVLLLVVNLSLRDYTEMPIAKAPTPAEMMTFQQQQELLAELIGQDEPSVAEPQKTYVPRPSSWRPFEIMNT